jgi:hypothetical protein
MPIKRNQVKDWGAVELQGSEYLLYSLFPGVGSPIWSFGCMDKEKPRLTDNDIPQSPYRWVVGAPGAPAPAELPHVALDHAKNETDRYVLNMSFAGTPTYRLLVVKQPGNETIKDVTFERDIAKDQDDTDNSYLEFLGVTYVEDSKQ